MRSFVIIAGVIAVLAAGFFLWRMTREASDVEAAPPKAKATAETQRVDDSAKPVTPQRDGKIVAPVAPQARSPQRSAPSAPAPAIEKPLDPNDPMNDPAFYAARMTERELKRQLVKQLDAIDGPVSECVQKRGGRSSGAAALTLKVERLKAGGASVVNVAVEPVDTTVKDKPLLDCLAATGKKIVLDLPDGVDEVTATHQVNLDGGAVTGHDLTAYDFKPGGRPVDPPSAPEPRRP